MTTVGVLAAVALLALMTYRETYRVHRPSVYSAFGSSRQPSPSLPSRALDLLLMGLTAGLLLPRLWDLLT